MPPTKRYVPKHARPRAVSAHRRSSRRAVVAVAVIAVVAGLASWAVLALGDDDAGEVTTVEGAPPTALSATVIERTTVEPATTAVATTTVLATAAPLTVAPTVAPSTVATSSPAVTTVPPPPSTAPVAGYGPGKYLVGTGPGQLPPGVYRTRTGPTLAMRCEVVLYDGSAPRSPLASHGTVIVDTSGASEVVVGRACPPLTTDLGAVLQPEQLTAPGGFPAGMYLAGEIPAGEYEVLADGRRPDPTTGRRCYWSVQARFTGREWEASGGGDEIEKNRITDRPQRTTFTIAGWSPLWPTAGVYLDYREVADNPAEGNPLHVPDAEIGVCTFRKVG